MKAKFTKFIAILFVTIMLLVNLPIATIAEQVADANAEARKLHTLDNAWKSIESTEKSELAKKASPKDVALAAYKATVNNPYVDKGSIVWEDDNQFAFTVDGMHCVYCYRVRNTKHTSSIAQKVVSTLDTKGSAGSSNVLLVGPYYGFDFNFTDQYRTEAQSIASYIGGSLTRLEGTNATGPAIASNYTNKGVVIYDSHGCQTGSSSYLCLTTNSGITSNDYLNGWAVSSGSAAFIDGRYIKNHINGTLSNCFVWMAICQGMKKEGYGTTGYALLSAGAAAVFGYSQSVTFSGDYRFEAAFWNEMKKGSTVREAINVMKNTVGYTDPYGSAWPIVMSASDPFPSNPDDYQTVNCDWSLYESVNGYYTVYAPSTYMRADHDSSADILTTIDNGAILWVKVTYNGWGKVTYSGQDGWILLSNCIFDGSINRYYTVITPDDTLNLRADHNSNSSTEILDFVPDGELLHVDYFYNGWGRTTYNGKTGWVKLCYCKYNSSMNRYYTVYSESIKMRADHSSSADVLDTIFNGAILRVKFFCNGWGKVTYNGKDGWILLSNCRYNCSINRYYTVYSESIELRADHSSSADILTTISNGAILRVTYFYNGWGKVTYNSQDGWILLTNCKYNSSLNRTYTVITPNDTLPLRADHNSNPSTEILELVPDGALLHVDYFYNGWGRTTYNGKTGWVNLCYCKYNSSMNRYYTVYSESIKMRADHSSSADVLDTIFNGAILRVKFFCNGWGKVTYNGKDGWILLSNCRYNCSINRYYTVYSESIELRADHSSSADILTTISNGAILRVTYFYNGWGKVTYNSQDGWILLTNCKYNSSLNRTYTVITPNDTLPLRADHNSNPSTEILELVPDGALLHVDYFYNGWGRTTYNGKTGWVNLCYCKYNSGMNRNYTVLANPLTMYAGNSTSTNVQTTIPHGTVIRVTFFKNGWGKTTYNGKTGWVDLHLCSYNP